MNELLKYLNSEPLFKKYNPNQLRYPKGFPFGLGGQWMPSKLLKGILVGMEGVGLAGGSSSMSSRHAVAIHEVKDKTVKLESPGIMRLRVKQGRGEEFKGKRVAVAGRWGTVTDFSEKDITVELDSLTPTHGVHKEDPTQRPSGMSAEQRTQLARQFLQDKTRSEQRSLPEDREDKTSTQINAKVERGRIRGTSVHGGYFDVPLMSQITEQLWVGGTPAGFEEFLKNEDGSPKFDAIFSMYPWETYRSPKGTTKKEWKLYDDVNQELGPQIESIADEIAAALSEGKRVYVHCQAGLNRSNLCAAVALAKHTGEDPNSIVDMLREKRGTTEVLGNPAFEKFVREWKPGRKYPKKATPAPKQPKAQKDDVRVDVSELSPRDTVRVPHRGVGEIIAIGPEENGKRALRIRMPDGSEVMIVTDSIRRVENALQAALRSMTSRR